MLNACSAGMLRHTRFIAFAECLLCRPIPLYGLIYFTPLLILDFLLLLHSDAWRSNPVTPIDPGEDRRYHLFFIKKGVIEILSFIIELGGLNVPKVKLQWHLHRLLYIRLYGSDYIAVSVWGYCFIRYIGTPRPDNGVRQDTFLTPFFMSNI